MTLLIIAIAAALMATVFMLMWLKERKHAKDAEIVAYGLRASDDGDDNTKTQITALEAERNLAIDKLIDLGQLHRDNWGNLIWTETGEKFGEEDQI